MGTQRLERLHLVGAGVLALVIALVGWFLLISPQRDETADIQSQTANAELANLTLQSRVLQLGGQQKQAQQYRAALRAARTALPDTTGAAAFLRQLQAIGSATDTRVTTVSVGTLAPASIAPAPVAPAAPSPAPSSAAPSGAAPSAPGGAASGVLQLPITATVGGTTRALSRFLTRLQSSAGGRAVLVTSVIRSSSDRGASTLQLSMTAFVAPAAGGGTASPSGGK